MKLKSVFLLALLTVFHLTAKDDTSAEKDALRKQIAKYEKDVERLNKKIDENQREAASERNSHSKYRDEFKKEVTRDTEELAKLNDEYKDVQNSADSLSRVIAGKQFRIQEVKLKEKTFKKSLLSAIDIYETTLNAVPAPIVSKESNALQFLKNEIRSGNVDNAEGLERLWQLTATVSNGRSSVDVWTGKSTYEEIQGQVHYIRIGYAWLACVTDDASKAAVWNFSSDVNGWSEISDLDQIHAVRNAVKIRNGNRVPEIISLPIIYSCNTKEEYEN